MTEVFIFEHWDDIRKKLSRAWQDAGFPPDDFAPYEAVVHGAMVSAGYIDHQGEATYRRVQLQDVLTKHFPYDLDNLNRFIQAVWKHAFPRAKD
jgi:hypothetical protein